MEITEGQKAELDARIYDLLATSRVPFQPLPFYANKRIAELSNFWSKIKDEEIENKEKRQSTSKIRFKPISSSFESKSFPKPKMELTTGEVTIEEFLASVRKTSYNQLGFGHPRQQLSRTDFLGQTSKSELSNHT